VAGGTISAVAAVTAIGWPAAVAMGLLGATVIGVGCWILSSKARTDRLVALIGAVQGYPARPDRNRTPPTA
jgi:hypothetical protein